MNRDRKTGQRRALLADPKQNQRLQPVIPSQTQNGSDPKGIEVVPIARPCFSDHHDTHRPTASTDRLAHTQFMAKDTTKPTPSSRPRQSRGRPHHREAMTRLHSSGLASTEQEFTAAIQQNKGGTDSHSLRFEAEDTQAEVLINRKDLARNMK